MEYTDADLHLLFATNFESAYHLSQLAHPLLASAAASAAASVATTPLAAAARAAAAATAATAAAPTSEGEKHSDETATAGAAPVLPAAPEVPRVRSSTAGEAAEPPADASGTPTEVGSEVLSGPRRHPGNASIVFISSVAGLVAIRSGSIYAATKGEAPSPQQPKVRLHLRSNQR